VENSKIVITIGTHSFNAEGPGEVVTKLYSSFEKLVAKQQELDGERNPGRNLHLLESKSELMSPSKKSMDSQLIDDLFLYDSDKEMVILRAEPDAASKQEKVGKALLLLLFGYKKLQGKDEAKASVLMKTLTQMGIPKIERLDAAVGGYLDQGYMTKTGYAKGTSYRVTNKGLAKGEEFAKELHNKLT
jgi:hypothetical protein